MTNLMLWLLLGALTGHFYRHLVVGEAA